MKEIKVKYRLKSHPTIIKKIGRITSIIGISLFLIGDYFISPILSIIPLELWIVVFEEIIPLIIENIWLSGLVIFFTGVTLESFNWRKGSLTFNETNDEISVNGLFSCKIKLRDLKEISIFNLKIGLKRSIRFKHPSEKLTIQFKSESALIDFVSTLIPHVHKYENIKVGSWAD